jgi:hypothetical protein
MNRSLTGGFRRAGRELMQQVQETSSAMLGEATEAIAREAEREGLSPERLGRKIRRAARHVRDVLVDAVADAAVGE